MSDQTTPSAFLTAKTTRRAKKGSWALADVPFGEIDRTILEKDPLLFYLAAIPSFIEITSDVYTADMLSFFGPDDSISDGSTHPRCG